MSSFFHMSEWETRVKGFADAVDEDWEDVEEQLKSIVGSDEEEAVASLSDPELTPDEQLIKDLFEGLIFVEKDVLKKHLHILRGK